MKILLFFFIFLLLIDIIISSGGDEVAPTKNDVNPNGLAELGLGSGGNDNPDDIHQMGETGGEEGPTNAAGAGALDTTCGLKEKATNRVKHR